MTREAALCVAAAAPGASRGWVRLLTSREQASRSSSRSEPISVHFVS